MKKNWCLIFTLTLLVSGISCRAEENKAVKNLSLPFLAIDLDGDGLEIIPLEESNVYFDVDGDGKAEHTAWIGPNDAFLTVHTRDEFRENNPQKRLPAILISGLEKVENFDQNNDGLYNSDDFPPYGRDEKLQELGFLLVNDTDSDGLFWRNDQVAKCDFSNFSYKTDKKLECKNGTYEAIPVEFEYEDTNTYYKAHCERLDNVGFVNSLESRDWQKREPYILCLRDGYVPDFGTLAPNAQEYINSHRKELYE